jgi:hypothetical protein
MTKCQFTAFPVMVIGRLIISDRAKLLIDGRRRIG